MKSFINRLNKIGIKIDLVDNYPWIYINKMKLNNIVYANDMLDIIATMKIYNERKEEQENKIADIEEEISGVNLIPMGVKASINSRRMLINKMVRRGR